MKWKKKNKNLYVTLNNGNITEEVPEKLNFIRGVKLRAIVNKVPKRQ
jgi:hypothetical protein